MARSNNLALQSILALAGENLPGENEFTALKAELLKSLVLRMTDGIVIPEVEWKLGNETAKVAFTIADVNGAKQNILIHGDYTKLRKRIKEIFAGSFAMN